MNILPQHHRSIGLEPTSSLKLDTANVASKEIDGEALIMNVANGMYYSLEGVGAVAWDLLSSGHSLEAVAVRLEAAFHVDPSDAIVDVTELAAHLVEEELACVADNVSVAGEAAEIHAGDRGAYAKPVLNVYSDMADLLALDPPMPGLSQDSWLTSDEG